MKSWRQKTLIIINNIYAMISLIAYYLKMKTIINDYKNEKYNFFFFKDLTLKKLLSF